MSIGECILLLFLFHIAVILWCSCQGRMSSTDHIHKLLKGYLGDIVTVKTDAGDVSGTLVKVDDDFIQLLKQNHEIVIIPVTSLNGIQREGKGHFISMDFEDQLKKYIGKEVEVFLSTELIQGILKDVKKEYFTVKVINPGYGGSSKLVNLVNDRIAYLQVIK